MHNMKFSDIQIKIMYVALTEYRTRLKMINDTSDAHVRKINTVSYILEKLLKEME